MVSLQRFRSASPRRGLGGGSFALVLASLGTIVAGCGDDATAPVGADAGPFSSPVLVCPGSAGCASATGQLEAGGAAVDITPDLSKYETGFTDKNGDYCFQKNTDGFVDNNGNNQFDALWMAGGCTGRPCTAVKTPLSARAIVLRQGETSLGIVYVDTIGIFDVAAASIRDDAQVKALGLDLVIAGGTHNHAGPDTEGLWGEKDLERGVDPDYMEQVRKGAVKALVDAAAATVPAKLEVAQVLAVDPVTKEAAPYVSDARDPMIFDPTLTLLRFVRVDDPDKTVVTLLNFAAHPEYTWFDNTEISADYIGWLRDVVETGWADDKIAGLGGVAVFTQGAVGGQVGPIHAKPVGPNGPISEGGHEKAKWAGINLGKLGLAALADKGELVDAPALSLRDTTASARVDNPALTAAVLLGVLEHSYTRADPDEPIGPGNEAYVEARISYVQIGPAAFITAPGELHPELWVGGYDGSWSWGQEILPEPVNKPDLGLAPKPPYLRDLVLMNPGVKYPFCAGLAHDHLGYIVAKFNFLLDADNPYFEEAEGEHYEETNSIGPDAEAQIVGPMMELVRYRK
jgi:hypothetical protein